MRQRVQNAATGCERYGAPGQRLVIDVAHGHGDRAERDAIGKDDPAGLIASENLRAEKKAIASAISNAERAEQVVNVAEGGLQEIKNLVVELQSLVAASANEAGLSIEEKDANQLQIDSILQTIDRLANALDCVVEADVE